MQAERHHIVDNGFAAFEHHLLQVGMNRADIRYSFLINSLLQPFVCNLVGTELRIPCQTAEGVPVGLRKGMSAPVGVRTDVADSGNGFQRSGRYKSEELFPHGSQVGNVVGVPQILLCNLEFGHQGRMLHTAEQRAVRFAWLEVDRAVLDLYDDVRTELSVQWLEFEIGLFGAVGIRGTVDESAPHDNTFIRLQSIGQHVGTFGMSAPEVARARLAFGVSFH